ncbi:4Fe-4S dicluster domain-containing protein [candidate division KSB1 bacterium]|nr:iron hydrogenase small subunit [candidate division KSB1 bacterium]RQW02671.1 MAG: 4Fe-4S dicluster domain-containing protein [candidate division KSB1 bacterium]
MNHVDIWIDNTPVSVAADKTIMQAAEQIGIRIPRLCYHPELSIEGACRVCIVEVEGVNKFLASCANKVWAGMRVKTNSPEIRQARRDIVELILDNHPMECQTCERDGNCELQDLAYSQGVRERVFEGKRKRHAIEASSASVIRNAEKCILCRRCVRVCSEVQGIHNLSQLHRGFHTVVAPAFEDAMVDSVCINCGQCINVCPTAAFLEKPHTEAVWAALADPKKFVVAHTAPAIRAALGEGFNLAPGTPCVGKTVTALRRLGFDAVFDTNFGADLTIVEEANEFVHRLEKGENLPLLTSCSPGWIKFMEHFYPEMIPYASSCKSPMSMLSTLLKTYYAEKEGKDPHDIFVVGIMPCVAKKFEAERPELCLSDGTPYTDAVLTTRETIWMIKAYGINFVHLPDGEFDNPLGYSSGAADIFGTTGGVMEAALRTAAEKLTGEPLTDLNFTEVRQAEGLKEATIRIGDLDVNVAVANGLNNAKIILDKVKAGDKQYHIIELMACPGGCIGGGGQPYPPEGYYVLDREINKLRAQALYSIDEMKKVRTSHNNPFIKQLYQDYLGEPGGDKAHHVLHTTYTPREPRGIK